MNHLAFVLAASCSLLTAGCGPEIFDGEGPSPTRGAAGKADGLDHQSYLATATRIELGQRVSGVTSAEGTALYSIVLGYGDQVRNTTPTDGDVHLMEDAGSYLRFDRNLAHSFVADHRDGFFKTYYVEVWAGAPNVPFELDVACEQGPCLSGYQQDDYYEPNDTPEQFKHLELWWTLPVMSVGQGDEDWFRVYVLDQTWDFHNPVVRLSVTTPQGSEAPTGVELSAWYECEWHETSLSTCEDGTDAAPIITPIKGLTVPGCTTSTGSVTIHGLCDKDPDRFNDSGRIFIRVSRSPGAEQTSAQYRLKVEEL